MKLCSKCRETKPLKDYSNDKSTSDGLSQYCRFCRAVIQKRYYNNHKDVIAAKASLCQKRWSPEKRAKIVARRRETYIKKAPEIRKNNLWYMYGLTVEQYEAMVEAQKGLCAICSQPAAGKKRGHVDHCKKTKKIRGILCTKCNTGIGLLGDDPKRLLLAVAYLIGCPKEMLIS